MNWLQILQLVTSLMPEVVQLITSVTAAVGAAPPEHQAAVATAITKLAAKR